MQRFLIAAALIFVLSSPAEARRHHRANDGRPRNWCGWWMRGQVAYDPGPAFNLARNWRLWGSPASTPAPGVIGVQSHHVFRVIEVVGRGRVLAISGNDGNAVRKRVRSMRGVLAWRAP